MIVDPSACASKARPADLDRWANTWVAIKNGEVIASAESSHQLAYRIREMGPAAKDCVMQYVRPAADSHIVGVG